MSQSAVDVDFGEWRKSAAKLLRGGTFSGRDGERRPNTHVGNDNYTSMDVQAEHFKSPSTVEEDTTQTKTLLDSNLTAYSYIKQVVGDEQKRVGKLNDLAQRDIYRLREQSLSVIYMSDFNGFIAVILKVTLAMAMLVLAVLSATAQRMITTRSGIILGVLVILVFGAIFISMCVNAASRRKDAWGHYYWDAKNLDTMPQ